jgi:preprotein translocase subunit SecA
MSKKKLSKAKEIQYKQWLAANPEIAKIEIKPLSVDKKPRRNDPCPCGSKVKYKKCCGNA